MTLSRKEPGGIVLFRDSGSLGELLFSDLSGRLELQLILGKYENALQ